MGVTRTSEITIESTPSKPVVLSKSEQREYAEEMEYNEADESRRKELLRNQQEKYEREDTRRKYQEDLEYEEEKEKTITVPTPKKREHLEVEARPTQEELDYEDPSEQKRQSAAERKQAQKEAEDEAEWFDKEAKKREKDLEKEKAREESEKRDKTKEQRTIDKEKRKWAREDELSDRKKKEKAEEEAKKNKPATWKDIALKTAEGLGSRSKNPKGKPSKGQFHAPTAGKGGYRDPFAAIDPFGGFGGGKMRNAMAMPSAGFGILPGSRQEQQTPQKKMTKKQEQMAKVRAAKEAPAAKPRMFADPFAGLTRIPTKKPTMPKIMGKPTSKRPKDIGTALGKGFGLDMGLGKRKPASKKPKKVNWMKF